MALYRRLLLAVASAKPFTWFVANVYAPLDGWVYRRSNGRFSLSHLGRRPALQTLLLTTTGRKSGQPRSTPVLYLDHDGSLVVVGSNFGRDSHPSWTTNLIANPDATALVHEAPREVRARLATEDEKQALWPRLLEIYPPWQAYTGRTDRSFRAFFLDPR